MLPDKRYNIVIIYAKVIKLVTGVSAYKFLKKLTGTGNAEKKALF